MSSSEENVLVLRRRKEKMVALVAQYYAKHVSQEITMSNIQLTRISLILGIDIWQSY